MKNFNKIYIFEEGIVSGGINETLCAGFLNNGIKADIHVSAINNEFVSHMSVDCALEKYNLNSDAMYNIIKEDNNER